MNGRHYIKWQNNFDSWWYGPLARHAKLRVVHEPGMPGMCSPPPQVSDPDMHQDVTHMPWCMSRSLTSGFLWSRWRGLRYRHSLRMRNPQFYVSVKRPMVYHVLNTTTNYGYANHIFTPLGKLRSIIHERWCRIIRRITQISPSLSNCRASHWKYEYIPDRNGPITYEHMTYKHYIIMSPFDYSFTYHAE